MDSSISTRYTVNKIITYTVLIIFAIIMLVPFVWMILTAIKTNQEAISVDPFYFLPHNGWHFENFATVWKSYNFITLYKNTILFIIFRVICACFTATMAGYAFGRLEFPGKNRSVHACHGYHDDAETGPSDSELSGGRPSESCG